MKSKKKIEFSKLIIIVTVTIFIASIFICIFKQNIDETVAVTLISATAASVSSCCVCYYNKAKTEFVTRLKITYLKEMAATEYKYFEKRMRLKKELDFTDEDVQEVNDSTILDDELIQTEESGFEYLNEKESEASADDEVKTI